MSITFNKRPDPMTYIGRQTGTNIVFTSTYATASDFVYRVKVVTGSSTIASFNITPYPVSYIGSLSVSNVLKGLIPGNTSSLMPTCSYFNSVGNGNLVKYNVEVTGSIVTGSSYLDIDNSSMCAAGTYYAAINGNLDYRDSLSFTYDKCQLISQGNFLTQHSSSTARTVRMNDYGTLAYHNGLIVDTTTGKYESSASYCFIYTLGTPLKAVYMTNINSSSATLNDNVQIIPTGPANINAMSNITGSIRRMVGTVPASTDPIVTGSLIESTNTSYLIAFGTPTPPTMFASSKVYTFNLDHSCATHTETQVSWLNPLGAYDFYTFTGDHRHSRMIARKNFNKHLNSVDANMTYALGARGYKTYNNTSLEEFELTSTYLKQDEFTRVSEIVTSTDVYIIDESGNKYPIIITNEDWDYKESPKDMLYRLTINYTLADNFINR